MKAAHVNNTQLPRPALEQYCNWNDAEVEGESSASLEFR